ncbi:MAG: YbaB/EbfC family nucleoid-associated protein [Planctomycetes bacterium]|nr:YbaB/EbfC family nucleoid-associated protein [Planctomycetota bacterium]
MFGKIGNLASLLKNAPELIRQAREMQGRMAEIQKRLAQVKAEGSAGGGMVTVEANGQLKVTAVRIEDSLVSSGDRELLEDLLVAAANQALDKAREAASQEMSKLTEGVELPGLGDILQKMQDGGGGDSDDEPQEPSSGGSVVV